MAQAPPLYISAFPDQTVPHGPPDEPLAVGEEAVFSEDFHVTLYEHPEDTLTWIGWPARLFEVNADVQWPSRVQTLGQGPQAWAHRFFVRSERPADLFFGPRGSDVVRFLKLAHFINKRMARYMEDVVKDSRWKSQFDRFKDSFSPPRDRDHVFVWNAIKAAAYPVHHTVVYDPEYQPAVEAIAAALSVRDHLPVAQFKELVRPWHVALEAEGPDGHRLVALDPTR